MPIASQLLRFASVGGIGFGADLALTLWLAPLLGPDFGRTAAILVAVGCTFLLNRRWTFEDHDRAFRPALARYCLVSAAGAAVNFGGYHASLALLAAFAPGLPHTGGLTLAVGIGSALALGLNFAGAKFFAFAK